MKTFTIDTDNNITVFASKKEAAAASATPFDPFTSQSELTDLAADWPANRLVEIWNDIPGVTAVTKFTNRKVATERIWKAIQNLGAISPKPADDAAAPIAADAPPESAIVKAQPECDTETKPVADVGAQVADVVPAAVSTPRKPIRAKKAANKAAAPNATGPREGSKTAQVVAMLERKDGATLAEIMQKMGWQKHTVRGFMAGAMKKAGHTVESFKSDKGERSYRINP